MLINFKHFEFFCNVVNILHVGPAATKVRIQIRGFLQVANATALTAPEKLLSSTISVSAFSFFPEGGSGVKAAYLNNEYEGCRRETQL
jgi:hypothetical protein